MNIKRLDYQPTQRTFTLLTSEAGDIGGWRLTGILQGYTCIVYSTTGRNRWEALWFLNERLMELEAEVVVVQAHREFTRSSFNDCCEDDL